VASEPFNAYLLSLTDPASEALAAITRGAIYPTPQTPAAVPAGSVIRGQVAAAMLATATGPALGPVSTGNPGPAAAALAAAPGQMAAAAAPALVSPAQAPESEESAAPNPSPPPEPSSDATAADATATAAAATAAANAGTTASAAALDPPGVATDATAKFMGGGTLGQSEVALSTYQAAQDAIPAVSEVQSAAPMTANTSTNSRGRTSAQPSTVRQAPRAPAAKPSGAGLDFTA
jgi:hypothetical protein